ncbi:MAG: cytochrome P450, partial [Microbacteriaceae bacterium]|nr:cytochrome P450 [Microbacteriaceae bacterium]
VGAFMVAGTETVVSYVPRLLAMLVDSGWAERAANDAEVREACVQEGLRVTTPTPVMLRATIAPTKIGDVSVRRGDRIILTTFLANRQPGEFSPLSDAAAGQKQLWFGAGVHFCIGAPLALAQTRAIVDAVLDTARESGGRLTVQSRRVNKRILIPSYRELLLRIDGPGESGKFAKSGGAGL